MELRSLGQYDIVDELGSGGMGVVFRAVHRELRRHVALKVILEKYADRHEPVERFKREAAVCAGLRHPNVITLYDYGEENGLCYYAMELLDAEPLDDWLERHDDRMSLPRLLDLLSAVGQAFAYIHERDLVHRDVKPANIMLGKDGHVTLMDFGLVKAFQETAITQQGKAIGTPRYMSPEMLRGQTVDRRSDIFQLGLVAFVAATGTQPFEGNDIYVLARSILTAHPPRPSSLVKGLPRQLDTFVLNCLEKDPDNRYQTAQEMLSDLQRVQRRLPLRRRGSPASSSVHTKDSDTTTQPSAPAVANTADDSTLATSPSLMSLDTTGVCEMMTSFARTLTWRHGLALTALLSCIPLFLVMVSSGGDVVYGMNHFSAIVDMDTMLLSWTSNVPYPTRARIRRADAPEESATEVGSRSSASTTDHELRVSGLSPGTRYHVAVLYPDGRQSLRQTVESLPAGDLEITRSRVAWPSTTSIALSWETNAPCRSSITFRQGGQRRTITVSDDYVRNHEFLIDGLHINESLSGVILSLSSLRRSTDILLGRVDGSGEAASRLVDQLEELDTPALLSSNLAETIRQAANRNRPEEAKDSVLRELTRHDGWQLLNDVRHIVPPLFSSPDVPLGSLKIPLYRALRRLEYLDTHLNWSQVDDVTQVRELYQPFITTTHSRTTPPPREPSLQIFSLSEQDSSFLPDNIDEGTSPGVAASVLRAYQQEQHMGSQERLRTEVDLRDFYRTSSDRPSLLLRVRNMTPDFYAQVTFNDTWTIDVANTQESAPPTVWLAVRPEISCDEHPDYLESVNYIRVVFPREFLRPGRNSIETKLRIVPGMATIHFVQLRELSLHPN